MNSLASSVLITIFKLFALFPLGVLRVFGRLLGRCLWWMNTSHREVTEENLKICFPQMESAERANLAKRHLSHLGMMAFEFSYIWHRPTAKISRGISRIEGDEIIRQSLEAGSGVIVLAPHVGNWEVLGLYLGENFPITNMYQPPDNPAADKMIYQARTRYGAKLVPTSISGVKSLLRALKNSEVVGVLPDQIPPKSGGEFVPFFNTPALTATLAFNLIQRTGAKVVLGYAKRIEVGGHFELYFESPPQEVYSTDVTVALSALNKAIEDCVRKIPEQYQWEYKRFKKQPEGLKKYYKKK